MTVRRNAFGRQVDSFEGDVAFAGLDDPVRAVFIRAPWVERVGDGVQVLARAAGHVVAVRQGPVLATAFHPEMTGDRRIHRLFVDIVNGGRLADAVAQGEFPDPVAAPRVATQSGGAERPRRLVWPRRREEVGRR